MKDDIVHVLKSKKESEEWFPEKENQDEKGIDEDGPKQRLKALTVGDIAERPSGENVENSTENR